MKKIFYFALIAIVATSCKGIYLPYATNHFGAQSQVVLNQANFRVVRNVEVVVDFDNTNMRRAEAEKSAYGELLREAQLTGSQVLINVVIEEVLRKGWHRHQYVAARATIIEFLDENGNPTNSQPYHPINTSTQTTNNTTDIAKIKKNSSPSTQQSAHNHDAVIVLQTHKYLEQKVQKAQLNWDYRYKNIFYIYNNIFYSLQNSLTEENIQLITEIQFVVSNYINSKTKAYPTLEKQLMNASSTEEEIAIFLSYYKE